MHFDDRLATVLRQPITGKAIARIQFRQLLDLLGTSPSSAQGPRIDAAYLRLSNLSQEISAQERAQMLRDPALRLRSPRLLAQLAEAEPAVASAAVTAARLREIQWLDLIPALPVRVRGFIRHRRGLGPRVEALLDRLGVSDRGLPPAGAQAPANEVEPEPLAPESSVPEGTLPETPGPDIMPKPAEGIGAIVKRIEEFRKTRRYEEVTHVSGEAPRLPLDDLAEQARLARPDTFDFSTDGEGRVVWSDAAVAPMAVGLSLASRNPENPVQSEAGVAIAFRRRQPVSAAIVRISGAPAIAGAWQLDAAPRFERPDGHFIGYHGRMRRLVPAAAEAAARPEAPSEADRMRQILHELRTPVNAIQGFAEVIQQQLFGPTPHEYRALAASIAADSAHMLAGFEELDRLVKLDCGALELEAGECDLAPIITMTIGQLEAYTGPRRSGFEFDQRDESLPVALAQIEAERLVWRLLATLAGSTVPGEVLRLRSRQRGDMARITVRLPASLANLPDEGLFQAVAEGRPKALSAGMFGVGFALRLAAAEARAAGGSLERRGEKLRLALPGLTRTTVAHSHDEAPVSGLADGA